ncbi:MAG TPA: sugar ABC transporter ATP-binding protein [Acidimicrobiales bacterium]|nr:sugar ABC transporter ATP-binding protein [Acidimicrobiales bacterium]
MAEQGQDTNASADGGDRPGAQGAPGSASVGPPGAPADPGPHAAGVGRTVLRIEHLSKTFPGTVALNDVSIEIERGTVHCLVGGNGSGKSSLIKILAGVSQGDPGGTITVDQSSEDATRTSPEWARSAGLHFVHQDLAVFPMLSVAENLAIGRGFPVATPAKAIRWRELRAQAKTVLERFSVSVDPSRLLRDLRPADRTMVAIARALQDQSSASEGILVLDEPTVALPAHEVDLLLSALRRYADAGQTILLVTHRLEEVVRIADRVTVLRDGKLAATLEAPGITEEQLVELIVGRTLDRDAVARDTADDDDVVLSAFDVSGGPLRSVTFGLRRGEVLGVAGLLGSGRTKLLSMLFGAYPVAHGTIRLDGEEVRFASVDDAMDRGIAFVPEDRSESAFVGMSLRENLSAANVSEYWHGFRLHQRAEAQDARQTIAQFSIKATSERQPFSTLSGGNQQKAIVARWLRRQPKVLLLDEPTQGVDIEARGEIYRLVRQAVAAGSSVIVVTSDFEELARVSDRVLILTQGRVTAVLRPPDVEVSRITQLVLSTAGAGAPLEVNHP